MDAMIYVNPIRELLKAAEIVGLDPREMTALALEELKRDEEKNWATFPPAEKVRIIRAMGFQPTRDTHNYDCPASYDSGNICNCVPEPTLYTAPSDVVAHNGETWEERLAEAKRKHNKEDE